MPKNKKYAGMKQPDKIKTPMGIWINNRYAGMRISKNTNISDFHWLCDPESKKTHTSMVIRTPDNDGHDNPARIRAAKTQARHIAKRY